MQYRNELLRQLPAIDTLLQGDEAANLIREYSYKTVLNAFRQAIDFARKELINGNIEKCSKVDIITMAEKILNDKNLTGIRKVINCSGTVLHTNLGRSVLPEKAAKAAYIAASNYINIEYDLATGERGDRHAHVEQQLVSLTGCESALFVNNNAAAVLLMLSALVKGGEVVVSRGELVEIGGSFRVPDIMKQSGCYLKEIGTTNKTRYSDYKNAITDSTKAILKVHTSNYKIVGFTEDVDVKRLAELAHDNNMPLLCDLGSGLLETCDNPVLENEPSVKEWIEKGADVVCFSGDKLLGGPQAGIIVGKETYISVLKKHPLIRALRMDKITLSALEATLSLYFDCDVADTNIPLRKMLFQDELCIKNRAKIILESINKIDSLSTKLIPSQALVGGGSAPGEYIPSYAICISHINISPDRLAYLLRQREVPVIGRIHKNSVLLDMFCVFDNDIPLLIQAIKSCGVINE